MIRTNLSLKWLEVFQLVARSGSVQGAANDAGLSVSTVSHHLRKLETTLDQPLFDHSRRPMRVTPAGALFLRHTDEALKILSTAETEAKSTAISSTRNLSLALVEDFDSEIGPELARALASAMPKCTFRHLTRPSHEILSLLRSHEIEIGIASRPQFDQSDLIEYPLLRDPFVLAVPSSLTIAPEDFLNGNSGLPLLRYSQDQIIGSQIEQHLRRQRITLPNRFEFESNQSIMNMVSEGNGWAITTPANFMRARRFHRQIALYPLPGKSSARSLSLFTIDPHDFELTSSVVGILRQLIQSHAIIPMTERHAWMKEVFRLLPNNE